MRNGIILIDKTAGMSSAQVVSRLKRRLEADKVGHAGTLDPDATGLLICLINGATRAASAGVAGRKGYEGTLRLGVRTSTDDMSGEVREESDDIPPTEEVLRCVSRLRGSLMQIPPRVSAVHVQGKRAHDLERQGVDFSLEPRAVEIFSFELTPISRDTYAYSVECSPGTYIRSLARDLGELLGCGGAVETIRRTQSGNFSVSRAVSLDNASWEDLLDWSELYPGVPKLAVPIDIARSLLGGREAGLREAARLALEAGIPPEPSAHLLYTGAPRKETWGVLRWGASSTLSFVANIVPQAFGSAHP